MNQYQKTNRDKEDFIENISKETQQNREWKIRGQGKETKNKWRRPDVQKSKDWGNKQREN